MERKGWPMTILRKLDEVFLSYKYDEVFSPTKHDEVFFSPVLTSKYTFCIIPEFDSCERVKSP